MTVTILAIESSCDDTSVAVFRDGKILSNLTANQTIHQEYGGVIPELASRAHQKHIVPLTEVALRRSEVKKEELDAIAFTLGPGLVGSLMVGVTFGKALALGLGIPIIAVNHMQAHILAHFIDEPKPEFPFLCLTVSGGHTQLVLVKDYLDMEIVGQTIDDAAGEAFDKSAKMLGLPYPGGPLVDKYAKEGDPGRFAFTEPQVKDLDFSFSGLKTNILYFLQAQKAENTNFIEENLADLCASIQERIVTILLSKLKKAARQHKVNHVAIAGGVSANSGLRKAFEETGKAEGWKTYIPAFQYCTDNAAMIAITASFMYQKGLFADQSVAPLARMSF